MWSNLTEKNQLSYFTKVKHKLPDTDGTYSDYQV